MSATRNNHTAAKKTSRLARVRNAARKSAAALRARSEHWSTAKKIGIATAAVALPILAAAITTAIVKNNKNHKNGVRVAQVKVSRSKAKVSPV